MRKVFNLTWIKNVLYNINSMKNIKVAIVEDNLSYLKLVRVFLENIVTKFGKVEIFSFSNPIDFKMNAVDFDIVILDYVFREYTYGANGFYLAKFIKEKFPETFVILNSSFSRSEIEHLLEEFGKYIDVYCHKARDGKEDPIDLVNSVQKCIDAIEAR